MRVNKFIALASGLSRRAADQAIASGRATVNQSVPQTGQDVTTEDTVMLDGKLLKLPEQMQTIILNKPVGYVCSRNGQGSKTIYDILPDELHQLKPVGRLDKDSSGLILLTNDGELANQLTHPRFVKQKIYEITLGKPLQPLHHQMIADQGIQLNDGLSRFQLTKLDSERSWQVTIHEGRNRQIRRTFEALGYKVATLHRTVFGPYRLNDLALGQYENIDSDR